MARETMSEKEAALIAQARAELAKKSKQGNGTVSEPAAAGRPVQATPAAQGGARVETATVAHTSRPAVAVKPVIAAPPATTVPPVAIDPMERVAALIAAEREATAEKRKRHRLVFLAIPAAIACMAAIWILVKLMVRA